MTPEQLQPNSLLLILQLQDDGDLSIACGHKLEDDLDEEVITFLEDVSTGMFVSFEQLINLFALVGSMARYAEELQDEVGEVEFEPDEELVKAIKDAKIIPFNKNKLN